ncbi:MAG: ATP-binding protein [Nitrososphaerota archaeon]|nr:ATP-binding protein [Nitrososphaerota archaeon]
MGDSHTFKMEYSFLPELVQRLSRNSSQSVLELVQNSYDADATKVLVTFLPDGLAVEDDAGMDEEQTQSFHLVGGIHADEEFTASGRRVVGKYRFGRLLVLGVYEKMEVRTRSGQFLDSTALTFEDLYALSQGSVSTSALSKPPLGRMGGSEFLMSGRKLDVSREECLRLLAQQPFLRTPGFEVYAKQAEEFSEWDFRGAQRVLPKDIPGVKVPVKIEQVPDPSRTDGTLRIEGVITIADDSALPLAEEDRGIGVVVSGLLVTRTYFGFEASRHRLDRVTGFVECVKPDTLILGLNRPISSLQEGDDCASQSGLARITRVFRRPYQGPMVTAIATGLLPIETTPEHPVLVVTSKTGRGRKSKTIVGLSEPYWKPARALVTKQLYKDGDYLLIPRANGGSTTKELGLRPYVKSSYDHRSLHRIPAASFPINPETAWLLGIYVAEGSSTPDRLQFSLHARETRLHNRIISAFAAIGVSSCIRVKENTAIVNVRSSLLARALPEWCGHLARNKKIPDFILFHNDRQILRSFLDGYLAGDGHFEGKTGVDRANTASKLLAQQLQLLCAKLGIFLSVRLGKKEGDEIIQGRTVRRHGSYELASKRNGERLHPQARILDGYIACPVQSVKETSYHGEVFNLKTSDSTYLVSNAVVHNCNGLKTTYGTKDRLIEDESYRRFIAEMRGFVEGVVIPKLQETEVRLVGRAEMKLLRRVDRVIGKVLAQSQLGGLFSGSVAVSPALLRSLVPKESILEQGRESSAIIVAQEETEEVGVPTRTQEDHVEGQGPRQAAPVSGPDGISADWADQKQDYTQVLDDAAKDAAPEKRSIAKAEAEAKAKDKDKDKPRRVAHYLHDVGIVVMFYDDAADERPSYSDPGFTLQGVPVKAVFINKKHPSYGRSETKNDTPQHLVRLITNEITAMGYRESGEAIRVANNLYGLAASEL